MAGFFSALKKSIGGSGGACSWCRDQMSGNSNNGSATTPGTNDFAQINKSLNDSVAGLSNFNKALNESVMALNKFSTSMRGPSIGGGGGGGRGGNSLVMDTLGTALGIDLSESGKLRRTKRRRPLESSGDTITMEEIFADSSPELATTMRESSKSGRMRTHNRGMGGRTGGIDVDLLLGIFKFPFKNPAILAAGLEMGGEYASTAAGPQNRTEFEMQANAPQRFLRKTFGFSSAWQMAGGAEVDRNINRATLARSTEENATNIINEASGNQREIINRSARFDIFSEKEKLRNSGLFDDEKQVDIATARFARGRNTLANLQLTQLNTARLSNLNQAQGNAILAGTQFQSEAISISAQLQRNQVELDWKSKKIQSPAERAALQQSIDFGEANQMRLVGYGASYKSAGEVSPKEFPMRNVDDFERERNSRFPLESYLRTGETTNANAMFEQGISKLTDKIDEWIRTMNNSTGDW